MRHRTMRPWLVVAGVTLAVIGQVGEWRSRLNGDAAYVLDTAGRMAEGTRLYTDVVDLNPPFVFWLNVPVAVAAKAAGIPPAAALRIAVLLVIALGGWLTWRVLRAEWAAERLSAIVLFAYVVTTLVLPLGYFGEREHLLLALIFPYVVLVAFRSGVDVSPGLASAVGIAAGVGVLLKPPAALLFLVLTAMVAARRRTARSLLLPETLAAGGVLGLGAMLVLVAAPGYLETVRAYGALYWEFSRRAPLAIAAGTVFPWTLWLALAVAGATALTLRARSLALALALAGLALFAAVLVQGKGFGYHYLPAMGMAVTLLILLLLGEARQWTIGVAVRRVTAGAALLLTAGVFLLPAAVRRAAGRSGIIEQEARVSAALVSMVPRGSGLTVLSSRLADAYPLAAETGARLATRLPHLWFVDAAYPRADSAIVTPRHPDRMTGAEAALFRMVGEDLGRQRPSMLLVRNPAPGELRAGDLAFDYLRYFCADPEFAAAATEYRHLASAGGFDAYRRDETAGSEPGRPCDSTDAMPMTASNPFMLRGE